VLLEGLAEEIGSDQGGLGARGQDHEGGAAGSGADIENAAFAFPEEIGGGKRRNAVDVEQEPAHEERDAGPENHSGEQDDGSLAPFPGERHQQKCEGGDEDHDVAVTEPPGIAEIDMGVHHHGLCLAGAALVLNGALRWSSQQ